jgi:hypothetical protein
MRDRHKILVSRHHHSTRSPGHTIREFVTNTRMTHVGWLAPTRAGTNAPYSCIRVAFEDGKAATVPCQQFETGVRLWY